MNESYTSFAQVYDMFMDNVDYPASVSYTHLSEWSETIRRVQRQKGA